MWPFARRDRSALGPRGEKLAVKHLRKKGYAVLARNYRCPTGEADIVMLDKSTRRTAAAETIVFVEVKTRSSDYHTDPQAAVNADKQRRMRRIAEYYLSTHDAAEFNIRFDVVAVVAADGEPPQIEHFEGAF